MHKQSTTHRPKAHSAGSVQARITQQLVDEAIRALNALSPVHLLLIALGGHWAVSMTSASEPQLVIEFAVGNEAQPHEADVDEPDFIGYLKPPRTNVALALLEYLRPLADMSCPFEGADVDWTLLDAFEEVLGLADARLRSQEGLMAVLKRQMLDDLPRIMEACADAVLLHVLIHAPPHAVAAFHGSLH